MNPSNILFKLGSTTVITVFLSLSCLQASDSVHSRPTASQVDSWLKAGATALGIVGTGYTGYNTYMKDGEVTRNFTNRNGRTAFSLTANCRDRYNVSRFWRHPNNGNAVKVIRNQFPNNSRNQSNAVLNLINWACNP